MRLLRGASPLDMASSSATTHNHVHPLHDVVLLGIVGGILGRDLQDCRDGLVVVFEQVPQLIRAVLVDQDDAHIVTARKFPESSLHNRQRSVWFNDEEIARLSSPVADAGEEEPCHRVLVADDCDQLPLLLHL
eukprot:CAMPEP_0205905398 /NCGR_PEP_ID=MMETSP1325-20131115/1325_1 /ASSEMBLY_ACC=CAM_ASM_000708 /TAXON_ID=236786 /ORGANISM="Florenciella sp., Strain RCC1007" /LENGTH=132 /DNA_ID=CAMNT_0053271301 /DNA_START=184 /DNA_END=582 /DNA_ORIENTATION=-